MSFDVRCPQCGSVLEAEDDMIGMRLNCPSCSTEFSIAKPAKQMRECPYCGEEILAKAKKCKHCGEFLDKSLKPTTPQLQQQLPSNQPVKHVTVEQTSKKYKLGGCLFALMMMVGLVIALVGMNTKSGVTLVVGALMGLIGIIGYFANRAAAWWHHG